MHRSLCSAAVLTLVAQLGCGDTAQHGAGASGAGHDPPAMNAGNMAPSSGPTAGVQAGSAASSMGGRTGGASGAGSGATGGSGGAPSDTAGAAGMEPQKPPCDPTSGGKVSKQGEYTGYSEPLYDGYERTSQYEAVRDGTRLAMDLFRPKESGGAVTTTPLPVLWMHTPYNRRTFTTGPTVDTYPGFAARLVEYGYVVAVVDYRGLYASFGRNVAFNRGEWIDAARMDAYDITEWLAMQPWSNGKIGMWGCSATGGSQLQATTTAPPHLKAVFPMSCEFDAYPFGVPGGMAPAEGDTKTPPGGSSGALRDATAAATDGTMGRTLLTQAIADHGNNIENPGYVPYRDSVAEKFPEQWWLKSSPHTYLDAINQSGIAMYLAANWNEGMTKYGAFFTFNNVKAPAKLIIGPAGHCEWTNVKSDTGLDIVVEEHRFFDHWLKDVNNCVMDEPAVYYYTYNAPAGKEWQTATKWPLPNEKRVRYYFGDGALSPDMPAAATASDEFTVRYDVTDANRTETGLVYATEALAAPVQMTGHAVVELWVSSTATDGDFVATVQDVAPSGAVQSYFMNGRLRASHRKLEMAPYNNLDLPWHPHTEAALQPLVPGEPTLLSFDVLPISIVFAQGHRIRVVVNFADTVTPQVRPAPTVTIYRDATHPSSITLPIVE